MKRRSGATVVDPLSLVHAAVPLGADLGGAARYAERARAELDARYPGGAEGLRGVYLVRRVPGESRPYLVCFGVPRELGPDSIAWTAVIPRRLCLRRRAVVIRVCEAGAGFACLARGIPILVAGIVAPGPTADVLSAIIRCVPPAFRAGPRYLLEAGNRDRLSRGGAAGCRLVRARSRPASDPALSARARSRRRLLALVALNAALCLAIGVTAARLIGTEAAATSSAPPAADASAVTERAGPSRAGAAPEAVLTAAAAVARHAPALSLARLRADGGRVEISGRGDAGQAVARTLAAAPGIVDVLVRSSRTPSVETGVGGSFDITVTVETGPAVVVPRAAGENANRARRMPRGIGAGGAAARVFEQAGLDAVGFEHDGAGEAAGRIRVRGVGAPTAAEAVVVGLAALEPVYTVETVGLRRRPDASWEVEAVLAAGVERRTMR